jgi:hypothetical protein
LLKKLSHGKLYNPFVDTYTKGEVIMKDVIETFGKNSGRVWQALNKYGSLTQTNLIKSTRLSEKDFYAAVGWLARENKIVKEGSKYQLGETNLTSKIGDDAGRVWHSLNSHGECDVSFIATINQIDMRDAYSALGWLAREDKLQMIKGRDKQPKFRLK